MGADNARPQSWVSDAVRTVMEQCDILYLSDRPVTRLSGRSSSAFTRAGDASAFAS